MIVGSLATLRLLQIGDSAFPSGGFAFSNGLETLVGDGMVSDATTLERYLRGQVIPRWAGIDRWFVREAHGASSDDAVLVDLDRLCESHVAVDALGEASRRVGLAILTTHARIGTPGAARYRAHVARGNALGHAPITQGLIGTGMALPIEAVEAAALYGVVSGVLTAGIRLGKIGALGAQALLGHLGDEMATALDTALPVLPHAFTPLADIAVSRHAGDAGRLFSS